MTIAENLAEPFGAGNVFVLCGRTLRPGVTLETTARVDDVVWDLTPAVLQSHVKSLRLNFGQIPDAYRSLVKQLVRELLSGEPPTGEQPQAVTTIRSHFHRLKRFLTWLSADDIPGSARPLRTLTAEDLVRYDHSLTESGMSVPVRGCAHTSVGLLWRYRSKLSDALTIDPRYVSGWYATLRTSGENSTDRIPEVVLAPLLRWCLRFVDDFADDILTAAYARDVYENSASAHHDRTSAAVVEDRLAQYLRAQVDTGTPLPGRNGLPNTRYIATQIAAGPTRLRNNPGWMAMIHATAGQVGLTSHTWLVRECSGQLDGRRWADGIATLHPFLSADILIRQLRAACHVVIAFLSGMRDSEIKHLRRGAVTVSADADGRPYRWKVASRTFKRAADPAGELATWVVGASAARAVAVLERLLPSDEDMLFSAPRNRARTGPAEVITTSTSNASINELVAWISSYCAAHGRDDAIPAVGGRVFRIRGSQFRRTLAWFIARRPGGSIAGAIQYQHHGIQMFEGYAGTSRAGFRAEVETEQALARGEQLMDLATGYDHEILGGPAAREARDRLADFAHAQGFPGHVVTDRARAHRFLARHDPQVYPGTYSTCVFTPGTARCLQGTKLAADEPTQPKLGRCQPLECANVAVTRDNARALDDEIIRLKTELRRGVLPPLLLDRLERRRDGIARLLGQPPLEDT
ncbi:hypothetical protein [Amycolatopsis orientalis]|uniref:hypothetical protein n=1 Tax=Amycolatopsis orientalis TaxID=31958 RepID=UPI000412D806|nr:hypothetical protein [Amycolatopsis orientalis]